MNGTSEYLRVGIIVGVHGLKGRLKVRITTDFPERLTKDQIVLIHKDNSYQGYRIEELTATGPGIGFLKLENVRDRDLAERLAGCELCIDRAEAEKTRAELLDEDSYYYYELIGCSVERNGAPFGEVVDILEAGSGEVLVIRDGAGKEHLVPFVESMVDTTRIASGIIMISPVEGVLDI